jgi:hypothetical protein
MCKFVGSIFYNSSDIPGCLAIYQAIIYTEKRHSEFSMPSVETCYNQPSYNQVQNKLLCLPYEVCKNSKLTTTYILKACFDTSLQYGNTQQYQLPSNQNHIRSPVCYEWRNSPVKPHKTPSVNLIVTSTQDVCTLDITMDRSFPIYRGCDPRRDFSLVEIFRANNEIQNNVIVHLNMYLYILKSQTSTCFTVYICSDWLLF